MDHQIDHGNTDHGLTGLGEGLVVFGQPSVFPQPGERPFDDPSLGQDDKPVGFRSLDDLDDAAVPTGGPIDEASGIAAVGPDDLQATPARAQLLDQPLGAIPILDVGRVDDQCDDQPQRVDDHMTLAAKRFLARVVPAIPPFSAVLTVWLSMIPALGVGFFPDRRRTCDRSRS